MAPLSPAILALVVPWATVTPLKFTPSPVSCQV